MKKGSIFLLGAAVVLAFYAYVAPVSAHERRYPYSYEGHSWRQAQHVPSRHWFRGRHEGYDGLWLVADGLWYLMKPAPVRVVMAPPPPPAVIVRYPPYPLPRPYYAPY